jgi:hypothetical protein
VTFSRSDRRSKDETLTGVGSEDTVGGKWRLSGVTSQKVVMFLVTGVRIEYLIGCEICFQVFISHHLRTRTL